jgi:O-antigen/teichoic acid export membrane protein
MRFSIFQIGERSAYYVGQKSDQMLIGIFLGADALGYYSFAYNLVAQPLSRINPILTSVAFPVFAKIQDDLVQLKRGYLQLVGVITTVNAPLLIGFAAVAPIAVPTIFGANWSESIVLVQILSFVTLLRSINNPVGSILYARGHVGRSLAWHIATLFLSGSFAYVGCRIGTVESVAMAMFFLQLVLVVPMYMLLIRPLIGRCAQDYTREIFWPIALALVMGLAAYFLPKILLSFDATSLLALQIIGGGLLYFALIRVVCNDVLIDIKSALLSR